jgi:uncharacterized protein (UPF0264 family)
MTRLLVSVRDVDEARTALEAGVDLIDLKEPRRGPLGAVAPDVIRGAVELVEGRLPISAALGELADWHPSDSAKLPAGLDFAKLGLAGCALFADWPQHWEAALALLPTWVASVAVVYADRRAARAPRPLEVLDHGIRLGCRAVLVDTFDKSGPGLIDCWPPAKIEGFVARVQQAGLWAVLAGSIRRAQLPQVLAANPDWIAIRGAVCRPSRKGRLDPALLRAFRACHDWSPNVQVGNITRTLPAE